MIFFLDQFPLVSVVIPTFNRCEYLKETLSSILTQSYSNFEVVIISDKSSDDTFNMIKNINDHRCKLYQLEIKSNGPAFVRNYGIRKSNGSLIAFCDDDDLWMPEKLGKQVALLNNNEEIAIVATNVKYFGEAQKYFLRLASIKRSLNKLNFIQRKYLLAFYNCLVISSAVVRRSVLEGNEFNETKEYQGHEDLDLWLRICASHRAFIIPEYLTGYRVHSTQLSTNLNKNYKEQSLKMLKERWPDFNLIQKGIYCLRVLIYKIFKY